MKSEEVKIVLERYFEGETTLEEERRLSEYFRQEQVPEELMPYREWFTGLRVEADIACDGLSGSTDYPFSSAVAGVPGEPFMEAGDANLTVAKEANLTIAGLRGMIMEKERRRKVRVRTLRITFTGIAASLLVAMGSLFWYQQQPDYRDTFDNPEQAVAVAGETLAFVSAKYNKGLEGLSAFGKLSESVQPARKHLRTIEKGFTKADLFGKREAP